MRRKKNKRKDPVVVLDMGRGLKMGKNKTVKKHEDDFIHIRKRTVVLSLCIGFFLFSIFMFFVGSLIISVALAEGDISNVPVLLRFIIGLGALGSFLYTMVSILHIEVPD